MMFPAVYVLYFSCFSFPFLVILNDMTKNSVVLYKSSIAVVIDRDGDKFVIKFCTQSATASGKKAVYSQQKVRAKDIVLLHEGPCSSLENVLVFSDDNIESQIAETYELLLSDESTATAEISLGELAEYSRGSFKADEAGWLFSVLVKSLEFSLQQDKLKEGVVAFIPRSESEISSIKQKNYEKEHESEIRAAFMERLKVRNLDLPGDARFMGEVEAFALCKTDKSKVLAESSVAQTIENAHKLLIETGIWDITKNPYPTRFGFSFDSAREQLGNMPEEERFQVPGYGYAIDSEHSTDPDDAIGFDGEYVWIHIADPAASVLPDSKIDLAARERGTTLYIPEGTSRMLCESSLAEYALGLNEDSKALSFRIKLDDDSNIEDCEVFKTNVKVKRLTYQQAEDMKESPELKPLFDIARKNKARREGKGAVVIQMPEVDIIVDKDTKKVSVTPTVRLESNDMIAELMIMAGEGAARFAFKNQIAFPYVSQESPEFPSSLPDGFAGEFAKIKCMRRRSVGITPAPHAGLGVSFYSQVTSPLRRYSDLISHEQLRAFISGRKPMNKDEMLERVAAGDAASIAAKKASRLSDTHWKLIYLLQNPDNIYEGICMDKRGDEFTFIIPVIDMRTVLKGVSVELNDKLMLRAANIDIPTQNVDFIVVD